MALYERLQFKLWDWSTDFFSQSQFMSVAIPWDDLGWGAGGGAGMGGAALEW